MCIRDRYKVGKYRNIIRSLLHQAGALVSGIFNSDKGINMISSTSNQQIKNIQNLMKKAKERKKQNVFIVEGPKMLSLIHI